MKFKVSVWTQTMQLGGYMHSLTDRAPSSSSLRYTQMKRDRLPTRIMQAMY